MILFALQNNFKPEVVARMVKPAHVPYMTLVLSRIKNSDFHRRCVDENQVLKFSLCLRVRGLRFGL